MFQNAWQINVLINNCFSKGAKHKYTIIDDFLLPKKLNLKQVQSKQGIMRPCRIIIICISCRQVETLVNQYMSKIYFEQYLLLPVIFW